MSFLSGSGGTNQTTKSFSYMEPRFYTPYQNAADKALNKIDQLRDTPYKAYDISKFGPMSNATQQQAWDQTKALQGTWQPYFDNAKGVLEQYRDVNPYEAAQPWFDKAAGVPSAQAASDPYFAKAGQSWNDAKGDYLNPYINDVVNQSNKLLTDNFRDNVLPGINSQYIASGGGAGGYNPAYNKDMGWATTNFNDSMGRTTQAALADAYNKAAGLFQNDAARWAGLGTSAGNLALGQQAGYGNLGQQAAGAAATGVNTGVNLAGAFGNLGSQNLNTALTGTNALLQTGNQQQEIENWKKNFEYQQFKEAQDWPFKTESWAANVLNQYQWPHAYAQTSQSNTTGSSGSSNSGLGSLLGGLSTIGSLVTPGAGGSSAIGNIFGGWFGGGAGNGNISGFPTGGGPIGPSGGAMAKRGGMIKGYYGGGHVDEAEDRAMIAKAVHQHERALHRGKPQTDLRFARGGYFGLDEASSPRFIANPGYFKWMSDAAFKDGGQVGHYGEGGDVLHGILGGVGSILGNLIPIPVLGPTIGKFAGHGLANIFSGKMDNMDDDLVQDFAAPLPFGGAISNSILRGGPGKGPQQGPGDMIEGGIGKLFPFAQAGMSFFKAGGLAPSINTARRGAAMDVAASRARAKRGPTDVTRPVRGGYFAGAN